MIKSSRSLVLIALVAAVLAASGCAGGGDQATPEAEATPTPQQTETDTPNDTEGPTTTDKISVSGVSQNETISSDNLVNLTVYGHENAVRVEGTHLKRLEVRDTGHLVVIGRNCVVDRMVLSGQDHEIRLPEGFSPEVQDSSIGTEIVRY